MQFILEYNESSKKRVCLLVASSIITFVKQLETLKFKHLLRVLKINMREIFNREQLLAGAVLGMAFHQCNLYIRMIVTELLLNG